MKLIMQCLDIMLEGLLPDEECEAILHLLVKYREWYHACTQPDFTETTILAIGKLGNEVADLYLASPLVAFSPSELKTRKYHMIFSHVCDTIRMYGSITNTNTSLWESYHRVIKRTARRSGNSGDTNEWVCEEVAMCQSLGTLYKDMKSSIKKNKPCTKIARFAGEPLFKLTMADFTTAKLNSLIMNKELLVGVTQLYAQKLSTLETYDQPTNIIIYGSCRLKNDLIIHCTPSFRSESRFDRVSIVTEYKEGDLEWFGEVRCLALLIYDNEEQNEKVAVIKWFEDVATVANILLRGDRSTATSKELLTFHLPVINRIDPNVPFQSTLTDGFHRLGRRYLTWLPRCEDCIPFSVYPITDVVKPEHLLVDRKLLCENNDPKAHGWYVQNTYTYFSNVSAGD